MDLLALTQPAIAAWLTAFARVAGWAALDPLLARLPLFLRLMLAAALAAVIAPSVAAVDAPFSIMGALALGLQALMGAVLALAVRVIFAAVEAALVWFGQTASGGLLALTDAQASYTDPGLRQIAGWLAVLAFVGANGHLLVVNALLQGLSAPAPALPAAGEVLGLAEGAGWLFATAVQLALPLMAFALLLHLSLAIVARTQPGVDMFSMGLALGALAMLAALSWAVPLIALAIQRGLTQLAPWFALILR